MRGKRSTPKVSAALKRITPADAGKTDFCTHCRGRVEDHPRGCGENEINYRPLERGGGSPPRMRGKHSYEKAQANGVGITPADAGKTRIRHHDFAASWDHPRGCGENFVIAAYAVRVPGSPPRMRGKPFSRSCSTLRGRITPADAGKTSPLILPLCGLPDHPRGCGENSYAVTRFSSMLGSPPRMRGKLKTNERKEKPIGITPADAGKTHCIFPSTISPWGSPPRMRGKQRLLALKHV